MKAWSRWSFSIFFSVLLLISFCAAAELPDEEVVLDGEPVVEIDADALLFSFGFETDEDLQDFALFLLSAAPADRDDLASCLEDSPYSEIDPDEAFQFYELLSSASAYSVGNGSDAGKNWVSINGQGREIRVWYDPTNRRYGLSSSSHNTVVYTNQSVSTADLFGFLIDLTAATQGSLSELAASSGSCSYSFSDFEPYLSSFKTDFTNYRTAFNNFATAFTNYRTVFDLFRNMVSSGFTDVTGNQQTMIDLFSHFYGFQFSSGSGEVTGTSGQINFPGAFHNAFETLFAQSRYFFDESRYSGLLVLYDIDGDMFDDYVEDMSPVGVLVNLTRSLSSFARDSYYDNRFLPGFLSSFKPALPSSVPFSTGSLGGGHSVSSLSLSSLNYRTIPELLGLSLSQDSINDHYLLSSLFGFSSSSGFYNKEGALNFILHGSNGFFDSGEITTSVWQSIDFGFSGLQNPLAKLQYVLADDADIKLKEDTESQVQQVTDSFTGDGGAAPSTSNIGDMASISTDVSGLFDSGYSAADGIGALTSADTFSFFSQEVSNELDGQGSGTASLFADRPLMEEDILSFLDGYVADDGGFYHLEDDSMFAPSHYDREED